MRLRLRIVEDDGSVTRIPWWLKDLDAPSMSIDQLLDVVVRDAGLQTATNTREDPLRFAAEVGGYGGRGHSLVAELVKEGDEIT